MNSYEKAIAEQLHQLYGYTPTVAKEIIEEYRAVMGLIGGYPMASDYAEYFHLAKQEGRTGKEWINAILKRREEAAALAQ
ncbi:hypothetical protein [Cohnella luojiensis]|uniref:Uncharacterized protein n=1 Tax=Cohnella luojiensis TaxID=652876 RepID=A0A4Y8LQ49_9BACL|nr:hypothetical protein [Cohnella luojiensis]TFE22667.1 hypothetical protein E2980_21180 [Cohnella luojiensis]